MLVLVLGWTQCLPQGVGAPLAMLRGRTAGFPKKTGRPGLRRGGVGGYNVHSVPPDSPPDCGTVAHQPRAGCIRLVLHSVLNQGLQRFFFFAVVRGIQLLAILHTISVKKTIGSSYNSIVSSVRYTLYK